MDCKHRYLKIAIIIAVIIATVTMIFGNSMQSSEKSTERSNNAVEVLKVAKPTVDKVSKAVNGKPMNIKFFSMLVRKSAHFAEFMLLGAEFMLLAMLLFKSMSSRLLMAMFSTLLIGNIDEYIQSFSERSSLVSDVLIDFSGAVFGILVIILISLLVKRIKRKRCRT